MLRWQVETAADAGCAGAFVFGWTDEWHRGGHDIEDWDFGLTTRDRRPKPALASVSAAFARMPPVPGADWPRMSVVVCTYNGEATLRDCLDGLLKLDYPDYEVIVVDDGSTDGTAAIAAAYPYRVISTENRGLSAARNTGLAAATGDVVAYTDDDARPDPDWLTLLALTFRTTDHAGVGGPNLPPAGDGAIADCVANAPGGPVHVLLSDREAEHIPGCNMAFRRECLEAVGGFDPRFRTAGDDVDLCWRLQERGWTLGFNPAAVVWHHRRNSLRMYWRQQRGYGRAEALLERKWPERYNAPGHLAWSGRLYGRGVNLPPPRRWRVYYGTWGSSPFQQLYRPADGTLASLPLMPEWYLGIAALAAVSLLGVTWPPLFLALPVLAACLAPLLTLAVRGAARARFPTAPRSRWETLRLRALGRRALPRAAGRPAGRTSQARPDPLARSWRPEPDAAATAFARGLERARGAAGLVGAPGRGCAPLRRRRVPPGRRLRPVGPARGRRPARGGTPADRGGGARRRTPADPLPGVAAVLRDRRRPVRRARRVGGGDRGRRGRCRHGRPGGPVHRGGAAPGGRVRTGHRRRRRRGPGAGPRSRGHRW